MLFMSMNKALNVRFFGSMAKGTVTPSSDLVGMKQEIEAVLYLMNFAHDVTVFWHQGGQIWAGPGGRLRRLSLAAAVLLLLVVSGIAREGCAAENAEQWRAVTRIRGTITVEHHEWTHEADTTGDLREAAQVRFTMVVDDDHGTPSMLWRAESAVITGSIHGEGWALNHGRSTTEADFSGVPVSLSDFTLSLEPDTGVWQLSSPGKLRDKYEVKYTSSGDPTPGYEDRTDTELKDSVPSVVFNGKVTGTPGTTSGSHKDEGAIDGKTTRGFSDIAQLHFSPEFDDVEVEVTIDDYAKWRPLGSVAKPATPGNHLVARAILKPKEGQAQVLPKVKSFRFALLDTSREPGVCMNWPLGATDKDYDLRLAAAPAFAGTVADNAQKIDIETTQEDEHGHPFVLAQVDSYDFGGRATLTVTCTLADGREVVGVMKGQGKDEEFIRLPKMKAPGWIADIWRKQHNVENLADDDDDEKVEGQKDNGDGYTLYEEYRGFVVAGRHIEGDPKRKDFFVLNLIGADALPGINLFEQLSELRVHSKLRRSEMSQAKRLMNGNHRDAPHRVDQHGVWVKTFTRSGLGDNGADTPMTEKGVAGRPGITKGIGILARDNTESIFNQPFNLPAQDAIFAFDRAIAHELLHSVGVEHHGPDDTTGYSLSFIPPNVPENKTGRPHYLTGDTVVNVLEENGHDLATKVYPLYIGVRQLLKKLGMGAMIESLYGSSFKDKPPGSPAFNEFVEEYIDQLARAVFSVRGMVGLEHGSHSGDQDCVMRYYFAKFYEAKNRKEKTLYLVTPGTERIGMQICRSGTGTGVNGSDHKPQSRYGNAAGDTGNCAAQICPNDAIPPRKVK